MQQYISSVGQQPGFMETQLSLASMAQRTFQDYTDCLVTRGVQQKELTEYRSHMETQQRALEERVATLQTELEQCRAARDATPVVLVESMSSSSSGNSMAGAPMMSTDVVSGTAGRGPSVPATWP